MNVHLLKSKIHRATVTGADLEYEGSISICTKLMQKARLLPFEKVDIYNCNNGERFSTYVMEGSEGEITLNGAAARCVHRGDLVIIACYAFYSTDEAQNHKPSLVFVDHENNIKH